MGCTQPVGFKILNVKFPVEATEYVYRVEREDGGTRLTLDGEIEMVRTMPAATFLHLI